MIDKDRTTARSRRIFSAQRDRVRGFSINKKLLALAFVVEAIVIGCGGFAGYQFAERYAAHPEEAQGTIVASLAMVSPLAHADLVWWMAIIATAGLCVVELCRVPLAVTSRTHASGGMRFVALVGVLLACGVTTKTMSQVLEQMFHPRLHEVEEATGELRVAEANLELAEKEKAAAVAVSDPKVADVASIDAKVVSTNTSLQSMGPKPKPVCTKAVYGAKNRRTGKRPLLRGAKCTQPEWVGGSLVDQLETLQAERAAAAAARDAAVAKAASLDRNVAQAKIALTEAADAHDRAVSNSQLHSFTAMVFGTDPSDITDAQVYAFLRFFVFLPAILIAIASTIVALVSVTRIRTARPVEVPRNEDGTLAAFIRDTAKRAVSSSAAEGVKS